MRYWVCEGKKGWKVKIYKRIQSNYNMGVCQWMPVSWQKPCSDPDSPWRIVEQAHRTWLYSMTCWYEQLEYSHANNTEATYLQNSLHIVATLWGVADEDVKSEQQYESKREAQAFHPVLMQINIRVRCVPGEAIEERTVRTASHVEDSRPVAP